MGEKLDDRIFEIDIHFLFVNISVGFCPQTKMGIKKLSRGTDM
jgi:hypothetical protein